METTPDVEQIQCYGPHLWIVIVFSLVHSLKLTLHGSTCVHTIGT